MDGISQMKAVVYTKYGPPDVLELKDVEKLFSRDKEVLIKVHAVSLNASDLEFLRGLFPNQSCCLFES